MPQLRMPAIEKNINEWKKKLDPADDSVFDDPITKIGKMLGRLVGLDDPTTMIPGPTGMALANPGLGAPDAGMDYLRKVLRSAMSDRAVANKTDTLMPQTSNVVGDLYGDVAERVGGMSDTAVLNRMRRLSTNGFAIDELFGKGVKDVDFPFRK